MTIKTVGIIGAGLMGNGIAQTCAAAGIKTIMLDINEAAVQKGLATISASFERLIKKEKLTPAQKDSALAQIKTSISMSDFKDVDLVIEAATENEGLKLKILKDAEFQVVGEAASAALALQVIKDKKPNVVITDIVMPEVSGIELTENINQNFGDIYVIVVSSLSQEHVVLEAIGAGAADFIAKPISQQQLVDSLEKIISQMAKD